MIDTQEGKIYYDGEIKERLAAQHPYRQWLNTNRIELEKLRSGRKVENGVDNLTRKELEFGFGEEDIDGTIIPMATKVRNLLLLWVMILRLLCFPTSHRFSSTTSVSSLLRYQPCYRFYP